MSKKQGGENNYWKILSIVFFIIFAVVLLVSVYYFVFVYINDEGNNVDFPIIGNNKKEKVIDDKKGDKCIDCVRGVLDGVYIEKEDYNPYPFALVIDNNISARPAYNLSKAKIVYEVEVEGGITRYLTIFDANTELDKIGPVRSARPYFIDWTKGLSGTLVHCGGSPSALAQIIKKDVDNLNEFFNETYFERDRDLKAPHNIFISSDDLKKYSQKNNLKESKVLSFKFKEDGKPSDKLGLQGLKIDYDVGYNLKWEYNKKDNDYIRYLDGEKHFDAGNNQITAKNIVVQFVNTEVVDDELRLDIDTIGSGDAIFCIDGECIDSKWKKDDLRDRTRYYLDGKELEFNAGVTWIEVVRNSRKSLVVY